uniref:Uncharacterized protein n=1 Tax=Oryza rufipogon TaxID=4529 RepID=A0A0E0Q4X7_ORYRU
MACDGAAVPLSSRPRARSSRHSPSSLPSEAIHGHRRFFPETAAISPPPQSMFRCHGGQGCPCASIISTKEAVAFQISLSGKLGRTLH